MDITYPDVTVELIGGDGNAFAIIAKVRKALRRQVGPEAAKAFTEQATSCGSYDELLQFVMQTVEVE